MFKIYTRPSAPPRRSASDPSADWLPPVIGADDWRTALMSDRSNGWYLDRHSAPRDPIAGAVAQEARPAALAAGLVRATDAILTWIDRHRQRRMLGGLSDHVLKDIGITRADVEREAGKRFWGD